MAALGNPGLEGGGRAGMQGSAGEMAELGNPGLRRRQQWEPQGTLGGKEGEEVGCEVILQTPPLFK